MKIRKDDILLILLSLLFASCRVGKAEPVADPMEEEGISVVRYDKLLDEYVRFNSFSALQKMNPVTFKIPHDAAASWGIYYCMPAPVSLQVSIFDESRTENLFRFPYSETAVICYNNIVVMETNDGWGEMEYGAHKVV